MKKIKVLGSILCIVIITTIVLICVSNNKTTSKKNNDVIPILSTADSTIASNTSEANTKSSNDKNETQSNNLENFLNNISLNNVKVVDLSATTNSDNTTTNSTTNSDNTMAEVKIPEEVILPFANKYPWETGSFDEIGRVIDNTNRVRINYYLPVDSTNYHFYISNNEYRIILNEYTENLVYICTKDLGDGDYISMDSNVKYVSVSAYKYKNGKEVTTNYDEIKQDFSKGFQLSYAKIDSLDTILHKDAYLSSEISKESLSNISNFRSGLYKSWGAEYSESSGSLCTRNFYSIEQKQYVYNTNDARAKISIQEYDEKGSWVKYTDQLSKGSKWTPQIKTKYIAINLASTEWATGPEKLMENGLVIYLADSLLETGTEKIDLTSFDFSNVNNWRTGMYNYNAKEYAINANEICSKWLLNVKDNNNTYMTEIQDSYAKMDIIEFDGTGAIVKNLSLSSGRKWKKQPTTEYIGISMSSNNKYTSSEYFDLIKNGSKMSLDIFTRYNHNTNMKDITANEFINTMNIGWNLGNSLDSHYGDRTDEGALGQETSWGNPYITKDLIDFVRQQGFNTIRIPVTWYYNTTTDANGRLHVSQAWLERVQDVVDYAIQNNMYVIMNTHHEQKIIYAGTTDEKIAQVYQDAGDLWTDIANYFKDYDEHLIFESYNEVDNVASSWNYSDTASTQMNKLNQIFVDKVRATGGNNAKRILMVPTLLDGTGSSFYNSFVLPTDTVSNKLMLQVHNYGTQFDQDIDPFFASLEEFSKKVGAPMIIGEFGTKPNFKPTEYRTIAASNYVSRAKEHGIRCIYWDDGNSGNYGLINRKDFNLSNFSIISALINPVTYKSNNKTTYTDMSMFVWKTLNQSTGELAEDKWWGTITTDSDGSPLQIPDGSDYLTLLLNVSGGAETCKIHYVHFYDSNKALLKANNNGNGFSSSTFEIPEGAKYYRVGINDSYHATNLAKYTSYFTDGNMKLTLGFIDKDNKDSVEEENKKPSSLILNWGYKKRFFQDLKDKIINIGK